MSRARAKYDAIVVGAGHNGLVAAAYLARAGLHVSVLETRAQLGGMCFTSEILPGVRVPALAHTVGRLRPSVARELGLRAHGLKLVQPEVRVFAPQPDGRALTLWGDAQRTAADLAGNDLVSGSDADKYAAVDEKLRGLGRALSRILGRVPPDVAAADLADAFGGLRAGIAARLRARPADAELLRVMPMAVHDLVGEWLESDALRAAMAARSVLYTGLGPRMPGTAAVLLTDIAGNDGGLAGQAVFARGGPSALIEALAGAAKAHGVEIRTGARVVRVHGDGERVLGVSLARGSDVDAPIVVSSLDPRTTLLDLLEPEVLGPRLSWRASNIRQAGATAKVNFALRDLPTFPAAGGDARRLRGRILVAPSMRYLELAQRPAKYGDTADEPLVEATIPSLVDPGLITPKRRGARVKHVLSAVVQVVAADADAGAVGDLVTRTLENYAPGFAELVEAREVLTPADVEREYGAAGGHPMHTEVDLAQWFAWRPLHGYGRYRMPLDGLYLAGSGAHPGGGVTGSPGRLAARAILDDVRRGRRRVNA